MKFLFTSPHLEPVCVLEAEVSVLEVAYSWALLSVHSATLPFDWEFNPFTFGVIMGKNLLMPSY